MSTLTLPDSLWAATANTAPETIPLSGEKKVDVAIIGAGFNGLRAAITLTEAGSRVAVIDAGEVGWGASGRNGGQVNPIGHEPPDVISKRWGNQYGTEYTRRYCQLTIQSADELFQVVKQYNISCDAEQNGWIRGVHGKTAIPEFEAMYQGWSDAGAEIRLIDKQKLETLSGATGYHMGWLAAAGGSVHPLSYARGLAKTAQSAGATIFSQTRITELKRKQQKWHLISTRGQVVADQLLLCTNGYTDGLIPRLQESIVPVISIQGATQPLTEEQQHQILVNRNTFSDTRRVIFYFRKTADNRLIFGTAGTSDETPGLPEKQRVMNGLATVYPQFPDLKLDYLWGGRIAVTQDHLPHIHQPAPGVFTGLGCNGRGVALSTVMGRLLAEMALGKNPKDLPIPVSDIHPYPFHRFHRTGIKIAVKWKEFWDNYESRAKI